MVWPHCPGLVPQRLVSLQQPPRIIPRGFQSLARARGCWGAVPWQRGCARWLLLRPCSPPAATHPDSAPGPRVHVPCRACICSPPLLMDTPGERGCKEGAGELSPTRPQALPGWESSPCSRYRETLLRMLGWGPLGGGVVLWSGDRVTELQNPSNAGGAGQPLWEPAFCPLTEGVSGTSGIECGGMAAPAGRCGYCSARVGSLEGRELKVGPQLSVPKTPGVPD